jgi:hypothetical protein
MNKYIDFLLARLCESILQVDPEFKIFIENLPSDNKLADDIFEIISKKKDIKTSYNFINLSDKNDEISFIPDTQYQRILKNGESAEGKKLSFSSVGRMIRRLINDNPEHFQKYSDSDIEQFVNIFKAKWDKKFITTKKIEIVKGDDILKWYNEDTYADRSGTLGNSCMRYSKKNHFMKIYADNTDKISMVILTENDRLFARALLWKLDESDNGSEYFLDRIYYIFDSDHQFVYDWVAKNHFKDKKIFTSYKNYDSDAMMMVNLKNVEYIEYPYFDTFIFLAKKIDSDGKLLTGGFLSNKVKKGGFAIFSTQQTGGELNPMTHRYSKKLNLYLELASCVYINDIDDYLRITDVVKCNYDDEYYLKDDVVFSEKLNDWVPKKNIYVHPKHGIVNKLILVDCFIEYIGNKKDPIDIYIEFISGEDFFVKGYELKSDNSCFRNEIKPSNFPTNSIIDSLVETIRGRQTTNIFCYPIFKFISGDIERISPSLVINKNGTNKFVTEKEAKFFDLKVDTIQKKYIYFRELTDNLSYPFYYEQLQNINLSTKPESEKKEYKEWIDKLYNFKSSYDDDFKEEAESYNFIKKSNTDATDLYIEIYSKAIDNLSREYGGRDNLESQIISSCNERLPDSVSIDDRLLCRIICQLFYSAYYLYFQIGSDSRTKETLSEIIESQLSILPDYFTSKNKDERRKVSECIFRAFYYDFDSNLIRSLKNIRNDLGDIPSSIRRKIVDIIPKYVDGERLIDYCSNSIKDVIANSNSN